VETPAPRHPPRRVSGIPERAATSAWSEPQWLDDALAWIERHVGPARLLKGPTAKPCSVVVSAQTADGVVWFKEVSPEVASEPALTAALAQYAPRAIPGVIAAEGMRLLMQDAGPHLNAVIKHEGRAPTPLFEEVVARYAELEIALVPIARELAAIDAGPSALAGTFGEIAAHLVDMLDDAIPFSLLHLDLFKKNICVKGREVVFLDWAVPAYGHPLCGIHVILNTLVQDYGASPGGRDVLRVRDAYLEPWTDYAPMHELRRIFAAANPLGALCRVMQWQQLGDWVPAFRSRYPDEGNKWLESFQATLQAPGKLGV
jgi:hypothetical protein